MHGTGVEAAIDTKVARVCRCNDGLIEVRMRDGVVVELAEIDEILAAQEQLVSGPAVVMVDSRPVLSMTREAQERAANTAWNRDTRAVAILIDNPVSTLLGNFFLTLSRPVYPTRLFRDESKARGWLLGQLAAAS